MKTRVKNRALKILKWFFKTTTLHGFKYLDSPYFRDRLAWTMWSCASTFCAAMLCSVLWVRFQEAPTMITRNPLPFFVNPVEKMPLVAICPSPYHIARDFTQILSIDENKTKWLTKVFSRILRGKPTADEDRLLLDQMLSDRNLSFPEALLESQIPCEKLLQKCRWQRALVDCIKLFRKELTFWGPCCVLKLEAISKTSSVRNFARRLILNVIMDCQDNSKTLKNDSYCREIFLKYPAEHWMGPYYLMAGHGYFPTFRFTSISDPIKEKLVTAGCVSDYLYSYTRCMVDCKESECGCSHPLRIIEDFEKNVPPPCTVMQMKCLGSLFTSNQSSCNCPPACERVSAYMSMDSIPLNVKIVDSFFKDVNPVSSISLNFHLSMRESRSHTLLPRESWFTLLSSFGGVFNMFMGVGLFSVLELLVLIYKLNF